MSHGDMLYTLVGFSAKLDWRPLRFVRPLPANRVCGTCGLVHPKTALLPCTHTLCESCYEQCAHEGLHICPLDECVCQDEDVDWRELPAHDLLKRERRSKFFASSLPSQRQFLLQPQTEGKVKCWNQGIGCQYVAPASKIVEHLRRECGYHSISCPKCAVTIPCCNVVAHIKSGCSSHVMLPKSNIEGPADMNKMAVLALCKAAFEEQVREVKVSLARILDDTTKQHANAINSFKETMRQELMAGTKQNRDTLAKMTCQVEASNEKLKEFWMKSMGTLNLAGEISGLKQEIKDELSNIASRTAEKFSEVRSTMEGAIVEANETSRKIVENTKSILRHVELSVAHCEFFVQNVGSLQQTAMEEVFTDFFSERVYLRGYCMSPGVTFEYLGGSVTASPAMRLHCGYMDEFLTWPFEHQIKFRVIHPEQRKELVLVVKPSRSDELLGRPPPSSDDDEVTYFEESLDIKDLISDGYVKDDQLRVKWYLLP